MENAPFTYLIMIPSTEKKCNNGICLKIGKKFRMSRHMSHKLTLFVDTNCAEIT